MLGLEGDAGPLAVGASLAADDRPVEQVAGVDLHPGLVAHDGELDAGGRADQARVPTHTRAPHGEMMVDPAGDEQLLVGAADPVPDQRGRGQVERGAKHRAQLAQRDEVGGHGGVGVGLHREEVAVDPVARSTVEVEVGVVGEVDHRGRGGRRPVVHRDRGRGDLVGHLDAQLARKALVPVWADQLEPHPRTRDRRRAPHPAVEAVRPTVQRVAALVGRDGVAPAVQDEGSAGDPVRVAADRGAEVGRAAHPVLDRGQAEDDVTAGALPVGDQEGGDRGPQLQHPQREPVLAGVAGFEGMRVHRSPVREPPDQRGAEGHRGGRFTARPRGGSTPGSSAAPGTGGWWSRSR